jgi:hypothetical protein
MATQDQVLIIRDSDGNFYVIPGSMLESGRVPDDQKAALEQAIQSDVSGFGFFNTIAQGNFISNPQNVSNTGSNFAAGFLTGPQNLTQVGINTSNIQAFNVANA